MAVRRLVPADAPTYRSLMLEAYALHPDAFTSSVAERAALPLSWWETRLDESAQAGSVVSGAFHAGALAGAAGLAFETRDKVRHKAQLFGMFVRADRRALGFGAALVRAMLDHARARDGVRLVQLTVTDGNAAAQRLYQRFGFVPFGLEPMAVAVGERHVAKLHMWCELQNPRLLSI